MRVGEQQQPLAARAHAREEIARARQPGDVRAHLAVQRTDVDAERARPVLDAIPVERAAALGEAPRDLGVGRVQVQDLRHGKPLRHEIAPDVIVVGLVEQRAVEIETARCRWPTSRARECGFGDMRGVSYGARMDASTETLVDFHTHSHFSDGVLAPAALVERARSARVGTLALTDHDTTAGLAEARARLRGRRDPFRARCRAVGATGAAKLFTSSDCRSTSRMPDSIRTSMRSSSGARRASGKSASGSKNARACRAANSPPAPRAPPRPRACTWRACSWKRGHARDTQEAFDRWLNRDKAGHVPAEWPALAAAMARVARQRRHRRCSRIRIVTGSPPGPARVDRGLRAGRWRGARSQHGRHESQ